MIEVLVPQSPQSLCRVYQRVLFLPLFVLETDKQGEDNALAYVKGCMGFYADRKKRGTFIPQKEINNRLLLKGLS